MTAGVQGVVFPAPKLHLGARIPLPISQVIHVDAPFSEEMVRGLTVPSPRLPKITQLPVPDLVFVPVFAFESVLGSQIDTKARIVYPQHLPPIADVHLAAALSPEMTAGNLPLRFAPLRPQLAIIDGAAYLVVTVEGKQHFLLLLGAGV
jgi:hypothetical protein